MEALDLEVDQDELDSISETEESPDHERSEPMENLKISIDNEGTDPDVAFVKLEKDACNDDDMPDSIAQEVHVKIKGNSFKAADSSVSRVNFI